MNGADEQITSLGTQLVRVDGDRIFMTLRGTFTAEDALAFFHLTSRVKQEHKVVFILYDARQCTGIHPDARKSVSKKDHNYVEADLRVLFGLSFTVRVLVTMLLRSQRLLFNRDVRVQIFEHEKEAREFFEKECDRLRKSTSQ